MRVARATATNSHGYVVDIRTGGHQLQSDESQELGGTDVGPSPFGLVLSGLAACTAVTLRMYAERKRWPLERVQLRLTMDDDEGSQRIERVIRLHGALDDRQRARLLEISERTPVTRSLRAGVSIATRFADDAE